MQGVSLVKTLAQVMVLAVAAVGCSVGAAERPACLSNLETPFGIAGKLSERTCDPLLPVGDEALPPAVRQRIGALEITRVRIRDIHQELLTARAALPSLSSEARRLVGEQRRQRIKALVTEAETRRLLRAVNARDPLPEVMTWFWFNHFNVFSGKGDVGAYVADYEERAIRPHVLGRFRDLLMATLKHPAMLIYLDNDRNASGAGNENYARELLELHTLGVDGGYTQRDVQELARILTGVGVVLRAGARKWSPRLEQHVRGDGVFLFDPSRHDFGDKELLGTAIAGSGFDEAEAAVDLLARHSATARHISKKLAMYFHSDNPPEQLVAIGARAFLESDGDIAETLKAITGSSEFRDAPRIKFKDPYQFVVSAARTLRQEPPIEDVTPLVRWLNALGQPIYRHTTPDGYGMRETEWLSASQMARRFELATPMVRALGVNGVQGEAPNLTLGAQTRAVLDRARDEAERRALLLSSPEFMYW